MQVCAGSPAGFKLGKSIMSRLGYDGWSVKQLVVTARVWAFNRNGSYPRRHLCINKIIIAWLKSTSWSKSVLQTDHLKSNMQISGNTTPEIYIQMSRDN